MPVLRKYFDTLNFLSLIANKSHSIKKYLLLFFYILPNAVFCCDCPPLEALSKKAADKYDVIFYGKVDSIIPCSTQGIGTAYFTISNLYKGSVERHVSVDYDCTSACMMSFAKNEEWIIYGIFQRFDLITVDLCSHSRKRITNGTADFYEAASQRTFEDENKFLEAELHIQSYASHNELNDQQKEFRPHNDQPTDLGKLWLLLISLATMVIIFFVSRKFFKNGK